MNYKNYKKYVVVDEKDRPMSFQVQDKQGGQFVYCSTETSRRPVPIEAYSLKMARLLIKQSHSWRKLKGYGDQLEKYFVMPLK